MDFNSRRITAILENALLEDRATRDATSYACIDPNQRASATILAKQDCILAGIGCVGRILDVYAALDGCLKRRRVCLGVVRGQLIRARFALIVVPRFRPSDRHDVFAGRRAVTAGIRAKRERAIGLDDGIGGVRRFFGRIRDQVENDRSTGRRRAFEEDSSLNRLRRLPIGRPSIVQQQERSQGLISTGHSKRVSETRTKFFWQSS